MYSIEGPNVNPLWWTTSGVPSFPLSVTMIWNIYFSIFVYVLQIFLLICLDFHSSSRFSSSVFSCWQIVVMELFSWKRGLMCRHFLWSRILLGDPQVIFELLQLDVGILVAVKPVAAAVETDRESASKLVCQVGLSVDVRLVLWIISHSEEISLPCWMGRVGWCKSQNFRSLQVQVLQGVILSLYL